MITILTGMAMTACLTLGAIHFLIWVRMRRHRAHLFLAVTAFSVAVLAACELRLMHLTSPVEWGQFARWLHVPGWMVVVGLVCFTRTYLAAGRNWLLWTIVILRTIVMVLNFILTSSINFREITSINRIAVLGETLSVPQGIPNPLMLLAQLSLVLIVIYSVDASVTTWRRGNRRRALLVGGSIVFFAAAVTVVSVVVFWGIIAWPIIFSLFFSGMIVTMGYELSSNVVRGFRLGQELKQIECDLRESEQRLDVSVAAGDVGVWTRDLETGEFWASEKWRELFGFKTSEELNFDRFLARIHEDDRESLLAALKIAFDGSSLYETEYRVLCAAGQLRWIRSRGVVEFRNGRPTKIRGASVDITRRKLAEEQAHNLSGQLIDAQEAERSRFARELHDDLSQSLALLSIQVQTLAKQDSGNGNTKGVVDELTEQIQSLSSDVHRMSHELHPAKLEQLGLEAAVRGFCHEFASAHDLVIECDFQNVPRALADNIGLCLYRVTQESLQNLAKHSGAARAKVTLIGNASELYLSIIDEGRGFNPESSQTKGSLGLVSMRERMRSVNGSLEVTSSPNSGTRVEARVRLPDNFVSVNPDSAAAVF